MTAFNFLSIVTWFVEGGPIGSTILTIILILVLLAAWKAPGKVKELGLLALAFGFFFQLLGIYQMISYMQNVSEVSPSITYGGSKVSMIPTMYGLIIYLISLIIRVIQKPRI